MEKFLVSFRKGDDLQYHVFTECTGYGCFVLDPLFRAFVDSGYTWSSIPCSDQLFDAVLFTSSKVEKCI